MKIKGRRLLLLTVIFAFSALSLYSQGGSNYSVYGLGDLSNGYRSTYEAMGGTQIAVPDPYGINLKNPAMLTVAGNSRLSVGYSFNQHLNEDQTNTLYQNNGQITGFHGLFKLDTANGVSIALGIYPYSTRNYLIKTPLSIEANGISATGSATYSGQGGVNEGYISTSFNVLKDFGVGASLFYHFGNLNSDVSTAIDNDITFFNSYNIRNDFLTGTGTRIGLYYRGIKRLYIGGFYETQWNNRIQSEVRQFSIRTGVGDTVISFDSDYTMPTSFGLGASYILGKFILAADYEFRSYSNLDFNQRLGVTYRDDKRYSIGINRIGNPRFSADLLDRIDYKFGAYYRELYYEVAGNPIDEIGFSVGGRVPWQNSMYSDIALTFGTRGGTNDGLIREYFGRLVVDISIGETWFRPFRREFE